MTFDGRIEAQFTVPAATTIAVTNSGGGPTTVTITAGSYYLSTFLAQLVADLTAQRPGGVWSASLSTGASGTGQVTLNNTGTPWSITWTSGTLRDLLGFTANIVAVSVAQTGTKQAHGVWIPDCPLTMAGDPARAPMATDLRATISPNGVVYSVVGNTLRRHTAISYKAVARAKVWEAAAALANASWETFLQDVQLGQGAITWFSPTSLLQVYDHNGIKLGADANSGTGVGGWTMPDVTSIEPKKTSGQWVGLWQIDIPRLLSSG